MKRVGIVGAILLSGCQLTTTEEALLAEAKETAFMPDCKSRVLSSWQARLPGERHYTVAATFAGSSQCMSRWVERLSESGLVPLQHGGWTKVGEEMFVVGGFQDPNRGGMVWQEPEPFPGVQDLTAEFSKRES